MAGTMKCNTAWTGVVSVYWSTVVLDQCCGSSITFPELVDNVIDILHHSFWVLETCKVAGMILKKLAKCLAL